MRKILIIVPVLAVILTSGYYIFSSAKTKSGGKTMPLELISAAFNDGAVIPVKYTGDGEDISPPLKWTPGPETTKGYAIVCDDPDAPGEKFIHWVVYNIPPHVIELPEALPGKTVVQEGIRQGVNSFGKIGYGGPAPPKGPAHRYYFKLYALDNVIDLKPGATEQELMKAIQGRVIEEAKLMGKYSR